MLRSTMMNAMNTPNIQEEPGMNSIHVFADTPHNMQEEQSMSGTKVFTDTHHHILGQERSVAATNVATMDINALDDFLSEWVTIKQLSERTKKMGIKEYRLRQWAVSGELPSIRAGIKYLINVGTFIDYITHADRANEEEREARTANRTARGGNRIRPLK